MRINKKYIQNHNILWIQSMLSIFYKNKPKYEKTKNYNKKQTKQYLTNSNYGNKKEQTL